MNRTVDIRASELIDVNWLRETLTNWEAILGVQIRFVSAHNDLVVETEWQWKNDNRANGITTEILAHKIIDNQFDIGILELFRSSNVIDIVASHDDQQPIAYVGIPDVAHQEAKLVALQYERDFEKLSQILRLIGDTVLSTAIARWERIRASRASLAMSRAASLVSEFGADASNSLLEQLLTLIGEHVPFELGKVFWVSSDRKLVKTSASIFDPVFGINASRYDNSLDEMPVSEGIVGKVVREGQASIINNVSLAPSYRECWSETVSEIAVPIKLDDEIVGVINLESATSAAFGEQDEVLLNAFAGYLAVVLVRRRYEEGSHAMRKLHKTLLCKENLNDLLQDLATGIITELPGYDLCLIWQTDSDKQALQLVGTSSSYRLGDISSVLNEISAIRIPLEHSVSGATLSDIEGRTRQVYDLPHCDQFYLKDLASRLKLQTMLAVPVRGPSQSDIIGCLNVFTVNHDYSFNRDDELRLEEIARTAAVAFCNLRGHLLRDAGERIGEVLHGNPYQEKVLFGVLETALAMTHSQAGSIFLSNGQRLVLKVTTGLVNPSGLPNEKITYEFGHGCTGWVAKNKRTVRLINVEDPTELSVYGRDLAHKHAWVEIVPDEKEPSGLLATPILARSNVLGVIRLVGKEPFTPVDQTILEAVCDRLAVALSAGAALEQQQQKLRQDIGVFCHQLLGPLSAIRTLCGITLMQAKDISYAHRKKIETIEASSRLASNIASNFALTYKQRGIRPKLTITEVRLQQLAEIAAQLYQPMADHYGIRIVVDNSVENIAHIEADENLLSQVFLNLIDNAIKYSKENHEIKISACAYTAKKIRIAFSNVGLPIDRRDRNRVFQTGYRTGRARKSGRTGVGIGLSVVQLIVKLHGGSIHVESKQVTGENDLAETSFLVHLPVKNRGTRRKR